MPKISKAARGKHRWVGLVFSAKFSDINVLKHELNHVLKNIDYRLYDYILDGSHRSCIIKIKLEHYPFVRDMFVPPKEIFSITSSGKIRLVRLRISEYFERQVDD